VISLGVYARQRFRMRHRRQNPSLLLWVPPVLMAAGAFFIDLLTPDGVLDGFPYVFAVLACQRTANVNAPLYTAGTLMPLMVLGFVLSTSWTGIEIACLHRFVAMAIIVATALAFWRHARLLAEREDEMARILSRLDQVNQATATQRAGMSNWLRDSVNTELDVIEWRLRHCWRKNTPEFDPLTESFLLRRTIQRIKSSVRRQLRQLLTEGAATSGV